MTWFDDGGNKPPFEPTLEEARRDRARCPECGQWPFKTKGGALRNHNYPWHHTHYGQPCPASGSQVKPISGQLSLGDTDETTNHPPTS